MPRHRQRSSGCLLPAAAAALLALAACPLAGSLPAKRWRPHLSAAFPGDLRLQEAAGAAPRVHVLSVGGLSRVNFTVAMQEATLDTMGPTDRFTNVCELGCAEASGGKLINVLEMDGSAFPGGACLRHGQRCDGYQAAQMKFVFGLVTEVRAALDGGRRLPEWYLVKDDDTFVNIEGLMSQVCGYSADEPISFAYPISCPGAQHGRYWIAGGRGWLVSRELASRLVSEHGDRWLALQARLISEADGTCLIDPRHQSGFTWDNQVPEVVGWVAGARLYDQKDLGPACSVHLGDNPFRPMPLSEARLQVAGCKQRPCEGQRHWSARLADCAAAPGCTPG